jgi:hypothetical protein
MPALALGTPQGTLRHRTVSEVFMQRPIEVTAIAVYHALFSLALVGTVVWQGATHHPADGWIYAAPVIAMMLFASLVPAVICVGLWIMDNGARIGCMIFALLHMMITVAYVRHAPLLWRPWARIALDAGIIAVLMLPRIRRAFESERRLLLDWNRPPV